MASGEAVFRFPTASVSATFKREDISRKIKNGSDAGKQSLLLVERILLLLTEDRMATYPPFSSHLKLATASAASLKKRWRTEELSLIHI